MNWILLLLFVALLVYAYRGRRDTAPAPESVAGEGAEATAVRFYWRPG